MRSCWILAAAIIIPLVITENSSALQGMKQKPTSSLNTVTSSDISRFSKARVLENSKDLGKENEARAGPNLDRVVSDLLDDAVRVAKLSRTKSLSALDELEALMESHKSIKAKLRPLLEDFATVEKLTPTEAATKWGIRTLFKTKSMEELANHPDYLLWKVYTKYWNKYHYSPA
ncbi:hypothetical protein PPTG_11954 [Phytophthora nicotianae INRA-310]|uniref:RxLR effector protein n=2 Tax=Phytophthora nicotianae TaxID=4792 RepID=W2Q5D0_PHYN3|nr:hypothetical protein PPTG_11954 [Phytophthora nicotianae INRA-310]ETN08086.1 hypothetical protein PPTG_11954 [Phytophthora nicotianae INRA-310]